MKWEMELDEIEAALEKIWDLHDKLSDAIHSISRAHFLSSVKCLRKSENRKPRDGAVPDDSRAGFVFVKDVHVGESDDSAMVLEAKSLNAIRSALENLEDQLEFFHTIQTQQRAERDAAIARLEQSRIVLAMRLSEHCGSNYKVIEEAQAFVGDVHGAGRFISPENIYGPPLSPSGEDCGIHKGICTNLVKVFISSVNLVKRCFKLDQMGGVVGNAALIAVSMIAMLHLQQAAAYKEQLERQERNIHGSRNVRKTFMLKDSSYGSRSRHLDVFSARG